MQTFSFSWSKNPDRFCSALDIYQTQCNLIWQVKDKCMVAEEAIIFDVWCLTSLGKTTTIHQLAIMLATSKKVVFSGYNHPANNQYWWPDTLIIVQVLVKLILKVLSHQYQWLAEWLWPENRTFLEVSSLVVSWWILAFLCSAWCSFHSTPLITLCMPIIEISACTFDA